MLRAEELCPGQPGQPRGPDQQSARGQVDRRQQVCGHVLLSLTKPQTVTDWRLREQDGPICISSDVVQDLAKPDPAGVHSVQYVGGGDIGVKNPERNCIERDLENGCASRSIIPPEGLLFLLIR